MTMELEKVPVGAIHGELPELSSGATRSFLDSAWKRKSVGLAAEPGGTGE